MWQLKSWMHCELFLWTSLFLHFGIGSFYFLCLEKNFGVVSVQWLQAKVLNILIQTQKDFCGGGRFNFGSKF